MKTQWLSNSTSERKAFTVLLVDDSTDIRERLVRMIQRIKGITAIIQASSVPEAITHFDEYNPQAVILDIHLHEQSGLDVLKHIKATPSTAKVILLTNHPYLQYRMSAQRLGADFFYNKFMEFDQALETLKALANPIEERVPAQTPAL